MTAFRALALYVLHPGITQSKWDILRPILIEGDYTDILAEVEFIKDRYRISSIACKELVTS